MELLSDVGNYDRVVIQDLLKEVAQTQQVDASAQKRFKGNRGGIAGDHIEELEMILRPFVLTHLSSKTYSLIFVSRGDP